MNQVAKPSQAPNDTKWNPMYVRTLLTILPERVDKRALIRRCKMFGIAIVIYVILLELRAYLQKAFIKKGSKYMQALAVIASFLLNMDYIGMLIIFLELVQP